MCTDETVNGAPFYVMGYVDGVVLERRGGGRCDADEQVAGERTSSTCWPTSTPSTSTRSGSGDLAGREGYVERQVKRWATQWEAIEDP